MHLLNCNFLRGICISLAQADEYKSAIDQFWEHFCTKVNPEIGAKNFGHRYGKLPMHKLLVHTGDTIRWLWDKFGILIAHVSASAAKHTLLLPYCNAHKIRFSRPLISFRSGMKLWKIRISKCVP